MIKIKCPICGSDSSYKSTAIDIMRLTRGGVVALQCGDEVRAMGRPVRQDPDAPYVEIEVLGAEGEKEQPGTADSH